MFFFWNLTATTLNKCHSTVISTPFKIKDYWRRKLEYMYYTNFVLYIKPQFSIFFFFFVSSIKHNIWYRNYIWGLVQNVLLLNNTVIISKFQDLLYFHETDCVECFQEVKQALNTWVGKRRDGQHACSLSLSHTHHFWYGQYGHSLQTGTIKNVMHISKGNLQSKFTSEHLKERKKGGGRRGREGEREEVFS